MRSITVYGKPLHFYFYVLLVLLIPFDAFISLSIILLGISVFFFQPLKISFRNIKERPITYVFAAFYLFYIFGMLYTSNTSAGLREMEYRLSILIFPLIIAASPKLEKRSYLLLLTTFVLACALASVISFVHGSFFYGDFRLPAYYELSLFHHTSYFSLYINFCFLIIFYLLETVDLKPVHKKFALGLIIFFFLFNLLLGSKMGIIISLLIFAAYGLIYFRNKPKLPLLGYAILAVGLTYAAIQLVPGMKERVHYMKLALFSTDPDNQVEESSMVRVHIWEQAIEIFKENPILGVGTGDAKDSLMEKYEENDILMALEKRLNAHNQYFELLLNFGLAGLLYFLFTCFYPLYLSLQNRNYVYTGFILLFLASITVESMLETQAGVVFYAFLNSLLFFHFPGNENGIGKA